MFLKHLKVIGIPQKSKVGLLNGLISPKYDWYHNQLGSQANR
ncbi:hypothetical protein VCR17J2_880025 [Vibrio coralliirubri]|nr:hypothetical protein VCR17J2_880025 [Vibrio coralliirubri]